jgi:hypothetical protein
MVKPTRDTMKNPEQKPGRSPAIGTPVLVRLQPAQVKIIDAWRREQKDLPSRAEAIRATAVYAIQEATKKEKGKR